LRFPAVCVYSKCLTALNTVYIMVSVLWRVHKKVIRVYWVVV